MHLLRGTPGETVATKREGIVNAEAEYAKAVWQWLRSEIVFEPQPETFNLHPSVADGIKQQCENFKRHESKHEHGT